MVALKTGLLLCSFSACVCVCARAHTHTFLHAFSTHKCKHNLKL